MSDSEGRVRDSARDDDAGCPDIQYSKRIMRIREQGVLEELVSTPRTHELSETAWQTRLRASLRVTEE